MQLEVLERSVTEQMAGAQEEDWSIKARKQDYKQRGSDQGRPKADVSLPSTGDQRAGGRDSASPTDVLYMKHIMLHYVLFVLIWFVDCLM